MTTKLRGERLVSECQLLIGLRSCVGYVGLLPLVGEWFVEKHLRATTVWPVVIACCMFVKVTGYRKFFVFSLLVTRVLFKRYRRIDKLCRYVTRMRATCSCVSLSLMISISKGCIDPTSFAIPPLLAVQARARCMAADPGIQCVE